MKPTIGIIGGSGLYSMPGFEAHEERKIDTPWGAPSDSYIVGSLAGKEVAFLARHARGHRYSPSELNFRANIYGFKTLGVERIISLSAVGSLKEEHKPTDFVIADQFFDRTRGRISTFFGEGIVDLDGRWSHLDEGVEKAGWTDNLLDNALKFSGGSHIVLRARPVAHGWRFEVEDDGQGLAPELREQLQFIRLANERFTVPEVLFSPSDIGINQAGIPEMITQTINKCPTIF